MTTVNIEEEKRQIPEQRKQPIKQNNKAAEESILFWIKSGNIFSMFIDIQHTY